MARYYQKSEDETILEEIKVVIAIRPTYGYRRVTTMVNRKRNNEGRSKLNRKRIQRIMQMNGLSLPQTMPEQKRPHTGVVMTMFPNLRWCSDGMEIRCFNGDKVFVAFALDCCDREAFAYVARTEPLSAEDSKRSNFPCCQGMGLIPIIMSAKLSNSSKVVALGISVNKYLMAS